MGRHTDKWFVEEFHLRSPVEEFEEHVRRELDSLGPGSAQRHEEIRAASELVVSRLRRDGRGHHG